MAQNDIPVPDLMTNWENQYGIVWEQAGARRYEIPAGKAGEYYDMQVRLANIGIEKTKQRNAAQAWMPSGAAPTSRR